MYESEQVDRQILNPLPENSRAFSGSEATLNLAQSSLLCQLFIPQDMALCINSDDLSDFYHGFLVNDLHAARNHIHGVFDGSLFADFKAYRPELHGKPVVGCFRTLAMGTSFAVELAQHSHAVLLYRAGAFVTMKGLDINEFFPEALVMTCCASMTMCTCSLFRAEICKAPSPIFLRRLQLCTPG